MITNKANKILFIISFLAFSKLNSQSFKYFNFTFEFDSIIQYGSDQKYYIKTINVYYKNTLEAIHSE